MHLRRTAFAAVLTALAMVVAGPASAATTVDRAKVVSALLAASQIGDGWHRYDDASSGPDPEVIGCQSARYETVGVRSKAERDFQYRETPALVKESVESFRTTAAARTDFTKGVRLFAACSSFTVDGKVWRVARLSVPDLADQEAMFRLSGSVATELGDVKLTMLVVATRHGRQQTVALVTVAGPMTAAQRRDVARGSVRIAREATAKVATVLGR